MLICACDCVPFHLKFCVCANVIKLCVYGLEMQLATSVDASIAEMVIGRLQILCPTDHQYGKVLVR